jgi:hypothetical protein
MKSHTNCEIIAEPLYRKLVLAFRKPPVILKIVPKAGYDMHIEENPSMREREGRNRNSGVPFTIIFRISKCFQRSKQKLYSYFSL